MGFYTQLGSDAGHEIQSYCVFIHENHAKHGLGKLTLGHAICVCRLNGMPKVMLKVHPFNLAAMHLYESIGYQRTGLDPANGNLILQKSLVD